MNAAAWGPALLSSSVVAATIPIVIAFMNRRHTRALTEQVQADRDNKVAETAQKWIDVLDENRTEAYKLMEQRWRHCEAGRTQDQKSLDRLIDAVTELIPLVPADAAETAAVRAAVRAARRARYPNSDE
ncbi:hypothetical protein PBI_BIGNUZ_30 [Mycobacterium phage BigNuz]|uniref:Uncharacterized protein n=2 Tax=Bignuzvirus bignuz TaxID=1983736 RepID=G1JX45_9CAUD|nr:hypothetical protein PBI_BIGNUZ_30 [Mycobacterium phage BigNuz]AEL98193.1 hypothetical protein PBI_BIGNUZ_30 [Mycobacterium phage BigNuz]AOT24869.1 hypothetical protein PBI_NAZO_30 [Mycobacterium phage Nazo]